jgi:sulfide:quinone oxidoreductase
MGKTALILGGGVGGIVAANRLRQRLPGDHRIVLFEDAPDHVFAPSLLWVAIGDREAARIRSPLSRLLRRGIDVVRARVDRIDSHERSVEAGDQQFVGDTIVVALGADLAPQAVPGLESAGFNLYNLNGALALREALKNFRGGRIVVLTAEPVYKCPAAPYEGAMLIEYDCRRRGVRSDVVIEVFAAEPGPMGVAGSEVSGAVKDMLQAKGIGYHPEHQIAAVDPALRRITFKNSATADYDLLVYVPPHRAPAVVVDAGLTAAGGWIPVDRETLQTAYPEVYAIGDIATIPLLMGKPLPKAGVFADGEAKVVADNIAHAWIQRGMAASFNGHGACFVETGDGKAAIGSGDFYAEPVPDVKLRSPSRLWHAGKVLFERNWLRRWTG